MNGLNHGKAPDATVMSYDTWGARRRPDGRPADVAFTQQPGRREFTGHETIAGVGLVNMNGRVYDPALGRFLSPDPNVQFASDLQSYNRYSYVLNNPLRYTDPTGYWTFVGGWFDQVINYSIAGVAIAACAGSSGVGCAIAFTLLTTAYNVSSAVQSGAGFNQIATTVFLSAASGALGAGFGGAVTQGWTNQLAAQIVSGGISGALSGAIMTPVTDRGFDNFGTNILMGAGTGAATAAATYWLKTQFAASQASAQEAQGGGEGGQAAQVERTAVADAQAGDAHRAQQQRAPMTREQAAARYGAIDRNRWPGRRQWVVHYDIPDDVVSDPSFRLVDPRGQQVRGFWVNRDLVPMLDDAFHNLQRAGGLGDLDTFNGSFNIRPVRGGQGHSAHSWGIAIDFNAAANPLGVRPTMPQRVVGAFTDAGFTWGGNWQRPDGMHFSLGF